MIQFGYFYFSGIELGLWSKIFEDRVAQLSAMLCLRGSPYLHSFRISAGAKIL